MTDKQHLYRDRPEPSTQGNRYHPIGDTDTDTGGWHGRRKTMIRRGVGVGAAVAAAFAVRRGLSQR
jgi:hypothetical protein